MGSEPVTVRATFKEAPKPVSGDGMPSEGDTSAEPGVATEAGTAESTSTEDATPTQQPADASSQGKKGAQLLPATGDAVAMAAIGAVLVTSGITVVLIRQKARRSS